MSGRYDEALRGARAFGRDFCMANTHEIQELLRSRLLQTFAPDGQQRHRQSRLTNNFQCRAAGKQRRSRR